MRDVIQTILESAVSAPSGDNAQPWRFRVRGNIIDIINVPEKDTSIYNHDQASNQMAIGALAENVRLLALAAGYSPAVALAPENADGSLVRITLRPGSPDISLGSCVTKRCSNRRPYRERPIEEPVQNALFQDIRDARIACVTDKRSIKAIARAVSLNERVVLENEALHRHLFEHVTWNKTDDDRRHGFYIDTFEFNPVQRFAFRVFSSWRIMRMANVCGAARAIAADTAKSYARSALYGAVLQSDDSPQNRLSAGMAVERIWVRATAKGLAMQMTAGIPFLYRAREKLDSKHREAVERAYATLREVFSAHDQTILCVFRIGYAEEPSGKTTRFAPEIEWL